MRTRYLRAAAGLTMLALAVASWPAAAQDATLPLVSAHRGGAAYAPENTMLAFENALRLGVDEIESDTQFTSDGELVIIHDATLDRTTDCTGNVVSRTLAELRACDAAYWFSPGQPTTSPNAEVAHPLRGTGVTMPTAIELLDWFATLDPSGPRLSIELKDLPTEPNFDPTGIEMAAALVPLIVERGLVDRVVVQSFWPASIDAVKRLNSDIATQFLTTDDYGETTAHNLAYVAANGHDISAPNFDTADMGAEAVAAAHAAGIALVPYTPDTSTDLQRMIDLGVDGAITNFPGCLLDLERRDRPADLYPAGVDGPAEPCPDGAATPTVPADRPDATTCTALRPSRWSPAIGAAAAQTPLRVVGIQFKQDVRHVETYASFRTKMRCLVEDHVVPLMDGRPMLVVFNEDIGLMTLAIGSRGETVRQQAATPGGAPAGDGAPAGIAAALGQLNAAYAPQIAAYQARYGPIDPRKQVFVGATDTMARAFTQTFSDIARDYRLYVVASNDMPRYAASSDPVDIATFGDPDLDNVGEVYVATSAIVTNQTLLWGPDDVDAAAPPGERNLLFRNDKVPLTSIEKDLIALDEGPASGPEAVANAAGTTVAGFHLGFATSLPAFTWGHGFGDRPTDLEPCADTRLTYMPCMDALGVDTVVQAEANPARWGSYQEGGWQPLEWMESTYRTVTEPTAGFRYNITPHLVGNLLDLAFDGQSAITARGYGGGGHYVGNTEFDDAQDVADYRHWVGDAPAFVVLAPWVVPDAPRADLATTAAALAPGSGDDLENDYLETAVWADLGAPDPEAPVGPVVPEIPPVEPLAATGSRSPAAGLLAGLAAALVVTRRRHR